ncbi:hypothetical protein JNM87_05125 [Candidatus Saccharibacteria bacterium]|nr:hypothetical protein [Candidatus Saccharibacteria bacterium]
MNRISKLITISVLLFSWSPLAYLYGSTSAVTASEWKAGRIIDDSIFTNANGMSVGDIQTFLNSKVPSCDTNGTKPATEYGRSDLTHAQYAASRGWQAPPYICLRNYYEVPKTSPGPGIPANNFSGSIPPGAISAAQIIYNAAQQYRINPKVLLVTIHKESYGPLTTDTWPLATQYLHSMGAHCPDTAACDSNYFGFSMQVYEAASLIRWYIDSMSQPWWQYKKPYQTNSIRWSPNASCGAGDVYIESKATAALYTYTPYQPNAAALANLYGTGDGCSAYGNRNFWRIYNDWFGSTRNIPSQCDSSITGITCIWELIKPGGEYFYTSSILERDTAINNGISYVGVAFYARSNSPSGGSTRIPTYRVQKNGAHFWTSSDLTYQQHLASGWTDEGIAWYTDPDYSNTGTPIYKVVDPGDNQSLYVRSEEYARFISWGYVYGGETLNSPTKYFETSPTNNSYQNVYRIAQCDGDYIYTVSVPEAEAMVKDSCNKYEGIAFYAAYSGSSSGTVAVNRFYNNGRYIWTASPAETSTLTNAGWKYEGIAFYAVSG